MCVQLPSLREIFISQCHRFSVIQSIFSFINGFLSFLCSNGLENVYLQYLTTAIFGAALHVAVNIFLRSF